MTVCPYVCLCVLDSALRAFQAKAVEGTNFFFFNNCLEDATCLGAPLFIPFITKFLKIRVLWPLLDNFSTVNMSFLYLITFYTLDPL